MSEHDEERRVAETLAGEVTFDEFAASLQKQGYSRDQTYKPILNSTVMCHHFYKSTRGLIINGEQDPPLISIFWYIHLPGQEKALRGYTIEIEIRGSSKADVIQIKLFPFSPEGLLLRLEELEARLIRAWKAAQSEDCQTAAV